MEQPTNNKNHRITIRLTESESEQLNKAWKCSSDLHLSSSLRKLLLGTSIKVFTYDRSRDHFIEEAGLLSRELSALHTAELSSFWLKTAISMQKELNQQGN